jgi:hypothetical protein
VKVCSGSDCFCVVTRREPVPDGSAVYQPNRRKNLNKAISSRRRIGKA